MSIYMQQLIKRSELRPKIDIFTLEKYFHNISYKTNAKISHNIRNNTRDG